MIHFESTVSNTNLNTASCQIIFGFERPKNYPNYSQRNCIFEKSAGEVCQKCNCVPALIGQLGKIWKSKGDVSTFYQSNFLSFFNQIEANIQNCSNLKSCSFNDHIQCATSILSGEFTNEGSSNAQARFWNFIIQTLRLIFFSLLFMKSAVKASVNLSTSMLPPVV